MARRVALKREMNSLKKAAEEPMTKFVARAKELRDQLAAAGLTTNDEEVAAALLAGLPSDYDVIVAVLETTADKMDLDVLLGKLLTVEQRLYGPSKFSHGKFERAGARAAEALSQETLTAAQPPPRFWLNRQRLFPALAVGFFFLPREFLKR